jgi:hypothetical protein
MQRTPFVRAGEQLPYCPIFSVCPPTDTEAPVPLPPALTFAPAEGRLTPPAPPPVPAETLTDPCPALTPT